MLDQLVSQTAARGAPPTVPIFITEIGIATDNGDCLDAQPRLEPLPDLWPGGGCAEARRSRRSGRRYGESASARSSSTRRSTSICRTSDNEHEHYFGVLTATGGMKGAYTATIRSLLRSLH